MLSPSFPVTRAKNLRDNRYLSHDEHVDDEDDDGHDEEDEHLGDPRPDGEERRRAAGGRRRADPAALGRRVVRPQVELHGAEQQAPDHHAERHLQRPTRRAVAHFLHRRTPTQWRQREFKVGAGGTSLVSRVSACLTEANCYARCYFNVRSKANMSQFNLPHGTDN